MFDIKNCPKLDSSPFKHMLISQTQFAFNLLNETDFNESVVISPITISITLGMSLLGAKNITADEIKEAIAKDASMDEIQKYFQSILEFVKENLDIINMTDKVYCIEKLHILDEYKNGIQEFYDGNFQLIDFLQNETAANEINKFVAQTTKNQIQNIVEPEMFNEKTAMILINALIFNGKWDHSFELLPNKQPFYSSANVTKEVSMMKLEVFERYWDHGEYEIAEIPYKDRMFSMFIILPKKGIDLSDILKNINVTKILITMIRSQFSKGTIFLPKFNIESSFEISKMLKNLNIVDAFDKRKADFSGIGNVLGQPIYISKVLQKSKINVDENGTVAAGAAVVEYLYKSSSKPKPFEFIADRPFIYFIADKNQNIYFLGTFCG